MDLTELFKQISDACDGMQAIAEQTNIVLIDDTYKVTVSSALSSAFSHGFQNHSNQSVLMVEIAKKDQFTDVYHPESQFRWNIKGPRDLENLKERLRKVQKSTAKQGPFDFSKRSTFIRRRDNKPFAISGNFVQSAHVVKVCGIATNGDIKDDTSDPVVDPWFMIEFTKNKHACPGRAGSYDPTTAYALYNMEKWWPVTIMVSQFKATNTLDHTDGKLLTVHDKFVFDLAVKVYSEETPEKFREKEEA